VTDKILKVDHEERVERQRGEELRMHLVRSKSVALIKSGQALSLRPDLLKSKIWAEELGRLVDEVGSFPDVDAMNIMREELSDLLPRIKDVKRMESSNAKQTSGTGKTRLSRLVESDPVLQMFEFYNDCRVVASASIGQVVRHSIWFSVHLFLPTIMLFFAINLWFICFFLLHTSTKHGYGEAQFLKLQ
jgi:predicted unusual protein kinase regulating ubiquinone biosynthesis (AarF/ABC1/UbiB family)